MFDSQQHLLANGTMWNPETTQIRAPEPSAELTTPILSSVDNFKLGQKTDKPRATTTSSGTIELTTSKAQDCEEVFLAFADSVVSEVKPATFEQESAVPPANEQILVRDIITVICLHVEEAIRRCSLETVRAQHKRVYNHVSAALESLIGHIVRNVVHSPQIIAQIMKAVIHNPGLLSQRPPVTSRDYKSTQAREPKARNTADNMSRME